MSLFCRESLKKYLLKYSDMIFEITIEALKFYESFFGYKYPFNKYDQIFVVEFNWGAMENAACVTFNDR
jgi:aminopeptidase N